MKAGEALEPGASGRDRVECALLQQFFSRAARRWPEHIALEIPPGANRASRARVTYAELEVESSRLAERLRPWIGNECVAAILLPRATRALYSSQLAILKAGGAYVCLDPMFPDPRVREILEDSGAVVLVTDDEGRKRLRRMGLDSLPLVECRDEMDDFSPSTAFPTGAEPAPWLTPMSLAYIVYTSGTTGRPKGVMIEHRSVVNLVASDLEAFRLAPGDRVAQGSSSAYDSSIEETWLAFSSGATLVAMDDDTVRLGPDLVDWLRKERITVFCPPPTLLRSSGCNDPQTALPDLRLLYVGGEPLPRDLADAWSRGRELVNGYGPTECAVTCLRERIEAGQPITIGRPIRGVDAWILNETLEDVAPGERGELYIGGVCLARGYWRHPGLTAEKFVTHERLGRIYRTGDVAHRDASGLFFYHGRADAQVKVRGYRIELGEIESRLAACSGVREAVCHAQEEEGQTALVAFVVPHDFASPPSAGDLREVLRQALPDYMVPGAIGFLSDLPRTVGGKLNRTALPRLRGADFKSGEEVALPRNNLESRMHKAFAHILRSSTALSIDADFFIDLGGDSLCAAQLVTLLRDDPATAWVTVRDVYEARTVAGLAGKARKPLDELPRAEQPQGKASKEGARPFLVTVAQAGWLAAIFAVFAMASWLVGGDVLPSLTGRLGIGLAVLLAPAASLAALAIYVPVSLLIAVTVKRLLIGRYQPISAPVWSSFYLRNWVTQTAVGLVPWRTLEGTIIEHMALRALGARLGARVHIHRGVDLKRGGWDLLEIGDDVTLNQDAAVRLVELHDGRIVVGPVSLRDGATLDVRAGVSGHTVLEAGAFLSALSWLSPGTRIPAGELWNGVPAKPAGRAPLRPAIDAGIVLSPGRHAAALLLGRAAVSLFQALPLQAFAILACVAFDLSAERIWTWMSSPSSSWVPWLAAAGIVTLSVPVTLVWMAAMVRAIGRTPEATVDVRSLTYIRVSLKTALVERAGDWLSGTVFWPVWLRWAGMLVGSGCEISTILDVVPDLVEIGPESFLADGIYLGSPRIQQGAVRLARTRLGRNTFLGNHVVVHAGQQLPSDLLIGISTAADDSRYREGSSWFGHPPFELPRREIVSADRRVTHEPSLVRYGNRVFWELLRFTLPVVPAAVMVRWFRILAASASTLPPAMFWLLAVPAVTAGAGAFLCLFVLGMKWTLLGRVRPGRHPLWSCWCSRWDFLYVAWGRLAQPVLSRLEGTLMLSWYLRAIGMKLGRRVVLGPGFSQVVDPDMIEIGDDATVNAMFQAHTFEDRVLKIDRITIRPRATLGAGTVPLYGADIGEGTQVAPHSVIMKHERLLPGRKYEGAPAESGEGRGNAPLLARVL